MADKECTIELPWPPSINCYWRRNGSRYFISKEGQNYRELVIYSCFQYRNIFNNEDRLALEIDAYPPDKRRRDLDNILKSLGDSLQHAGVYQDDNQIDKIIIARRTPSFGKVVVKITLC